MKAKKTLKTLGKSVQKTLSEVKISRIIESVIAYAIAYAIFG